MRVCHFVHSEYALAAIRDQRLKVATIRELNDPFELMCADLASPQTRRDFAAFKTWTADRYGLLCFTKGWRNPLMWSHYAQKHRGAVLEFQLAESAAIQVRYSRERIVFDLERVALSGGFSEDDTDRLFATKSHHWAYEREIRVPVKLNDCISQDSKFFERFSSQLQLIGIVVGPLCELTEDDVAGQLPEGMQIVFRKSRLAFRSYNVVRQRSYSPKLLAGLR